MRDASFIQHQNPLPGSTVVVAMSGGVDSSLVAYLMAERGCRVIGATMSVYDPSIPFPEGTGNGCYGPNEEEDEQACRRLCASIGAEYRVIDLSVPYRKIVLDNFKSEYRLGRTPNPCLRCNPSVKFGLLPEALREQGISFDYYATGHYARIASGRPGALSPSDDPGFFLSPGLDGTKDQSYFLQRLSQKALSMARFPLGGLSKVEVRKLAREKGLEVADKKDSQDFVSGDDWSPLFADSPSVEGEIVHADGRRLGRHHGIERYTVGQRRGVGVSVGPEPLYVLALDAGKNRVVVGPEKGLFARALEADEALWTPGFGAEPFRAWAKIRLASRPAAATVIPLAEGRVRVEFDTPQRAIAPGQSAAFYVPAAIDGEAAFAGGEIDDSLVGSGRIFPGTVLVGASIIQRAL